MAGLNLEDTEHSCLCSLLTISDQDQLSEWSDFTPQSNPSSAAKPYKAKRQQKSNKFGYCRDERVKFRHHNKYDEYMKDYNEVFLKSGPYRHLFVNPVQYGGPYSQRPPVLRARQTNTYTPVQRAAVEKEDQPSCATVLENNIYTLADSCRLQPHPPTEPRKMLSYEDIKDYIVDESEDDVECKPRRYLKSRKPVDVNLTGKFMKRASGMSFSPPTSSNNLEKDTTILTNSEVTRSDATVKYGSCSSDTPPKLALHPKPAPSVNYKLPASLPYKVTARPPSQSARMDRPSPRHVVLMKDAKFDDSLAFHEQTGQVPFRMNAKQTTVSKSLLASSKSHNNSIYRSEPCLAGAEFPNNVKFSSLVKNDFSRNGVKTEKERKKQLHELVKILGQSTLTPYLQKLRGVESRSFHRSSPGVNKAELIDYSVVFGTRL